MSTIKRILLASDGSGGSKKAANFAGELTQALGASLTALIVQDEQAVIFSAWNAGGYQMNQAVEPMSTNQARAVLERETINKELKGSLSEMKPLASPATLELRWGHPATEICTYASENAIDLIVIGSHGRTGIKRAILGSVSHAVANQAPCAVTIVR